MILDQPFGLEDEAEVWAWVAELFDTPDSSVDGPVVEVAYPRTSRFVDCENRIHRAYGLCTQIAVLVDNELITKVLYNRMIGRIHDHMNQHDGGAAGYYFDERPERVLAALFLRLEVLDEAGQG